MKKILLIGILMFTTVEVFAHDFNPDTFAKEYFIAWSATQSPKANKQDIENYLEFLADDIGHQHLPYDPEATRSTDGKAKMREGMSYYLGAHTEYKSTLISLLTGYDVIIIKYETHSKGIHPQTKEELESKYKTIEVLELENNKVSVIRKYSE
jgi:hypothetical protein